MGKQPHFETILYKTQTEKGKALGSLGSGTKKAIDIDVYIMEERRKL